jgi:hypothetical protein
MSPNLAGAIADLEGVRPASAGGVATGAQPPQGAALHWSAQALDLLNQAESKLKAGDWQGFGESLKRLHALLQQLAKGGGAAPPPGGHPGGR